MKCHFCDTDTPDVEPTTDPFAWEINGEEWVIPLCDNCIQLRHDEI
ncbi:hypothetical protein GCM10010441_38390 [Kitasatospora paracochleata]|uniref:Small CPxCG-related zinc finger protein n=1 Tax=Kitasatospora paracochleata TaxID=58354 RepID=A0ABT1IP64_9ACTN|nr:hypothetical protein [Kitasatospora paracochleata]MCP2306921.1 hypothetical protein [Kitasatospora paracochleata]